MHVIIVHMVLISRCKDVCLTADPHMLAPANDTGGAAAAAEGPPAEHMGTSSAHMRAHAASNIHRGPPGAQGKARFPESLHSQRT